ncbi:MAG TPA: tetratricopeptide repeat protein [Methylotenera sp.]|nr:tetratricopeptide repeat protein [Methylotenera sp.]
MQNKKFTLILLSTLLFTYSSLSVADWFTSSETKELISKADAGDRDAQFKVGLVYDSGTGAPKSGDNAKKYYRLAAEQGHVEAQNSLGSMLQAEKNYAEAKSWYERAAAQNHPMATNSLGYLYDLGLGIPQDRNKGFELYSRSADLGWAEAMWSLAIMYGAGQIGKPDMLMACFWTVRAQKYVGNQNPKLSSYLDRAYPQIKNYLSGKDLNTCQQEANMWSPKLVKQ